MSKKNHLLKRKNWIFDLDGTLTIAVHDFNAIRKELGILTLNTKENAWVTLNTLGLSEYFKNSGKSIR